MGDTEWWMTAKKCPALDTLLSMDRKLFQNSNCMMSYPLMKRPSSIFFIFQYGPTEVCDWDQVKLAANNYCSLSVRRERGDEEKPCGGGGAGAGDWNGNCLTFGENTLSQKIHQLYTKLLSQISENTHWTNLSLKAIVNNDVRAKPAFPTVGHKKYKFLYYI